MSEEIQAADATMREIERLRAELDATRADLDTLRNGVAWLGAELDRVKAWAACRGCATDPGTTKCGLRLKTRTG